MGKGRDFVHDKRAKKNDDLFFSLISFPFTVIFELLKFVLQIPIILFFGGGKKKKEDKLISWGQATKACLSKHRKTCRGAMPKSVCDFTDTSECLLKTPKLEKPWRNSCFCAILGKIPGI